MDRRKFLTAAGTGLAASTAAATLAAPAIAQSSPAIKWRLTSSFPKSLDTIFGASEVFARAVGEMTDGRFQIQLFAAGELVPGLQALDAAEDATVELAHTCSYYYVGKDPTFAIGTAIPFGLNARQQTAWMNQGGGMDLLNDFYSQYNVVAFPCGNTGAQMGGWFRREINSADDLRGLKMRIAGIAGQVVQALGVVPQQLAGADVYPALEKGTIDAAEWVGPYDDEKLGFQQVAQYYYYPGWWEAGPALHLFANRDKWNALPKAYQAVIRAAAAEADTYMIARYDTENPAALRRLVANGAQLRSYPRDILEAAYEEAQKLYADLAASNANWKKIYEPWNAFRNDAYLWFRVAEYPNDSFVYSQQAKAQGQ